MRPFTRSMLLVKSVTRQMLSGASGVTFCPMFGLSPAPLITSDFTASTRSLPPSAVAASLTICISGGTREHALESTRRAHESNRDGFIIVSNQSARVWNRHESVSSQVGVLSAHSSRSSKRESDSRARVRRSRRSPVRRHPGTYPETGRSAREDRRRGRQLHRRLSADGPIQSPPAFHGRAGGSRHCCCARLPLRRSQGWRPC